MFLDDPHHKVLDPVKLNKYLKMLRIFIRADPYSAYGPRFLTDHCVLRWATVYEVEEPSLFNSCSFGQPDHVDRWAMF